jgi:ERF superfamily
MAASRKSTEPIETTATEDEPIRQAPTNVITAIAAVIRDMSPIAKLTPAQRQRAGLATGGGGGGDAVNYAFRGIEEITAELQRLVARHCIVIVPSGCEVLSAREVIRGNNKPWQHVVVEYNWTIYGPGGTQDCISASSIGEGLDNGDKGNNKARTMAFKNLLLTTFMVADPADDVDGITAPERSDPPRRAAPVERQAGQDDEGDDERPDPRAEALTQLFAEAKTRNLPKSTLGDVMETVGAPSRNPLEAAIGHIKRAIEMVRMMDPDAVANESVDPS